jgi:23S rRNA pseudouridine2605 synthase
MSEEKHKKERIAKVIARAGVCSRREAERLIEAGKVKVNGEVLDTPAFTVDDSDEIEVKGKPLPGVRNTCLFLYHKPAGLVTTTNDERGRATIFDHLPDDLPRLITVGRLDINTEGLLLLTNDGELSRYLELPATGWKRQYRVRAHGRIDKHKLDILRKGAVIEGVRYKPINVEIEKEGTNSWLRLGLREGKNREVRRVLDWAGLTVNRLIRTDYGPFALGKIQRGHVEQVMPDVLHEQIKGFFKS